MNDRDQFIVLFDSKQTENVLFGNWQERIVIADFENTEEDNG